ncbi:MAG: hypothetical protein WC667_00385 [Sulfurimonas sp.]|jgi:hypothetical protein
MFKIFVLIVVYLYSYADSVDGRTDLYNCMQLDKEKSNSEYSSFDFAVARNNMPVIDVLKLYEKEKK